MSWREFLLRQTGYNRTEINDWRKFREVAYNALIGSHIDPKKLPKSIDNFLPLDGQQKAKSGVSDEAKKKFLELHKKWQNERKYT